MKWKNWKVPGSALLLLAAMIWGAAFVAQSLGADSVEPFTFNAVRSLIGSLAIVPVFLVCDKKRPKPAQSGGKCLLLGGIACGVLLFLACNLQQFAISTPAEGVEEAEEVARANVGKVGFLTALYIVLVPVFGIFCKKKPGALVLIGVALALIGMYLLCIKPGFTVSRTDVFAVLCAVAFAAQIMVVDHVAPRVDCLRLSSLQFLVCGLLSLVCALIWEKPAPAQILEGWAPLLYVGVMSSGVAYTLQIVGQVRCRSEVASLIMSLESVFSVLFGYLFLHQALTPKELIGCAVMFAAVLLAQMPDGRKS